MKIHGINEVREPLVLAKLALVPWMTMYGDLLAIDNLGRFNRTVHKQEKEVNN